jgi:tetratricopeptide (TPR) repeat protein
MRYSLSLVFALASALNAQSPDPLEEGRKALEAEKYDAALELFTKAVSQSPADYAAHFHRALALSLLGKDSDASAEYQRTLDLKPGLYEAELNLGISLLRAHQPEAAVPHVRAAAEQKPDQFRPIYYVGEAELDAKHLPEAEQAFRKSVALDASSAAAQSGLGRALAKQGKLTEAVPYYLKAASLEPFYKEALLDLAARYEDAKQPEDAVALYRQFADNPGAQERIGVLLLAMGKPEDAVGPLEFAVGKSPTSANRLALAQVYVRLKQPAKAEPLASKALEAAPGDVELRMFYGRLLRDQRKFPLAAAQFRAAGQASPTSVEAWSELAGVLILMEQYPDALGSLDRVRALKAETAGHFFLRGMALDHLHQPKDAIVNYNQFLALSQGKNPDQEFQARQRVRTLEYEVKKR